MLGSPKNFVRLFKAGRPILNVGEGHLLAADWDKGRWKKKIVLFSCLLSLLLASSSTTMLPLFYSVTDISTSFPRVLNRSEDKQSSRSPPGLQHQTGTTPPQELSRDGILGISGRDSHCGSTRPSCVSQSTKFNVNICSFSQFCSSIEPWLTHCGKGNRRNERDVPEICFSPAILSRNLTE